MILAGTEPTRTNLPLSFEKLQAGVMLLIVGRWQMFHQSVKSQIEQDFTDYVRIRPRYRDLEARSFFRETFALSYLSDCSTKEKQIWVHTVRGMDGLNMGKREKRKLACRVFRICVSGVGERRQGDRIIPRDLARELLDPFLDEPLHKAFAGDLFRERLAENRHGQRWLAG